MEKQHLPLSGGSTLSSGTAEGRKTKTLNLIARKRDWTCRLPYIYS
jgi:hypothetical protein